MQNAGLNSAFDNPLAQQLRECVSKLSIQIFALNASLVEQTATGFALCRPRNLSAVSITSDTTGLAKQASEIFGAFVSVRTVTIPYFAQCIAQIECTR